MFSKKTIRGCEGRGDADDPYLDRYTLLKTKWGNLYLHVFHRSDHDVMHDHPWNFWTLVLWRGYRETYKVDAECDGFLPGTYTAVKKRRLWPGMIVFRPAEFIHRVELLGEKPAVTLVWRGPYVREWGFHTGRGIVVGWREYFKRLGCAE